MVSPEFATWFNSNFTAVQYKISAGTYLRHDNLIFETNIDQNITFICGGITFTRMYSSHNEGGAGVWTLFGEGEESRFLWETGYGSGIDHETIIPEDQEVSYDFYTWFNSSFTAIQPS